MSTLSLSVLRSILSYNPDDGVFTWRARPDAPKQWRVRYEEKPAGYVNTRGYVMIAITGRRYYAHRLAWLYTHGHWPKEIDHANRRRDDNRLSNLRLATRSQNHCNRGMAPNNTSGFKGVYWDKSKGKWGASISFNRRSKLLGRFETREEAAAAYAAAAPLVHGEFARIDRSK